MEYTYQGILEKARYKIIKHFKGTSKVVIHNKQVHHISAVIDGNHTTFYVKNDKMVELSGVVDIDDDYYGLGYRSVLEKDNVDYWIYVLRGEYYLVKTSELRKKVLHREYDYKSHGLTKTGADKKFFQVKENKFKSWCRIV